jgi:hypothetical protein
MADLDALARELEQRAHAVQLIGDRLLHEAAVALWTSVAADAFRASVARRRADCGEVADLLQAAAGNVRRFGLDAQAERARLAQWERGAVRGALHGGEVAAHAVGIGLAEAASLVGW